MNHFELNRILQEIRNPDKRNWILMVPNSLGETVTVCGFCKSFLEKHGYGITLVIPESHYFIAQCFPDTFDRIVKMPLGVMRQFSETGFIPPNFFNVDFPINTWFMQHGDGRLMGLFDLWVNSNGYAGLDFLNLYRYILRLDWKSKFTSPLIPSEAYNSANIFIKKNNIKKKKTVILFIGNNTQKPAPKYFWERITDLYLKSGFDVVINMQGAMLLPEELIIKNVKIINIPLEIAIPVCEYAGNIVAGSNGFVFFALASKIDCNIDILMTEERCCDYTNLIYEDINYLEACNQLNCSEIILNKGHLREWLIKKNCDNQYLELVANGIVFGKNIDLAVVKINK